MTSTSNPPSDALALRRVRSFVRREGRMTAAQRRALDEHWPRYGVECDAAAPLDLDTLFGRRVPRTLEIGFGMGEALFAMAEANPDRDHIGIEVYRPGVGSLLRRLAAHDVGNVRVLCCDAVDVLRDLIPEGALDAIHVFFPDPWPKKRHHKRRLIDPGFAALAASRLRCGGLLHLATDWEDYAYRMMEVLEATDGIRNVAGPRAWAERPQWRPPTRFERRGVRLGHGVWDLLFERAGEQVQG